MTAAAIPPTAPAQVLQRRYSVEEYLEIERKTNQKHIFINGLIYPTAGAKPPHLRISGNVFGQLYKILEDQPYLEVFNSETKIYNSTTTTILMRSWWPGNPNLPAKKSAQS